MRESDIDLIWDVAFDARVYAEDNILLEEAGIETGMEKGVWKRKLKDAMRALELLETLRNNIEVKG
jgi:hypothetical protein